MYLIALCDNEAADLNKVEQLLNLYEKEHPGTAFLVERFENAIELLYRVREKNYLPDFVLMDIYMPEKTGIEAARELRGMGINCKIIFLTVSKEHALDAFGVDAAQYLVQPVNREAFFQTFDRFVERVDKERKKYFLLRIDGKVKRVMLNEILYCEAQGKFQYLYFINGEHSILRVTMTELYEMLSKYTQFVRVGISYIVNLEHIDSMNAREIFMEGGKKIHLPRGAYKSLKEQYFQYYCE